MLKLFKKTRYLIIIALIGTVITILIYNKFDFNILYYQYFISCLFIFSLIIILKAEGWLKFILKAIMYSIVSLVIFIFLVIAEFVKPNYTITDEQFYRNEIFYTTKIDLSNTLSIEEKIDTIKYFGIEEEYDAECIFRGPKKEISLLKKEIEKSHNYIKEKEAIDLDKMFDISLPQKSTLNFQNKMNWYRLEKEGSYRVYIAFNGNKMFYHSIHY